MQNRTSLFLSILLGFNLFFSGCGSSKPQVPKKVDTPKWVKIQPNDTSAFTYGIGIDKTREDALKSALNDVISKLGIKVESSFTNKQIVDGYYSKSISTSDIKTDVAKIRITNYKIEKSHRISYREYAVLVKVDNKKFFNTLKQDIDQIKKDIETKLEESADSDAITRYNIKKKMSKECERLLSNSLVAYELNKSFNKNKYFNFVSDVKESYYSEANSLRFFISADKNSKDFAQVIKRQLIDNGFSVTNNKNLKAVIIKLNTTDNIASAQKIVTIKLNIKVTDEQKNVGSNTLVLKERLKKSKSSIYNTAAIHFNQDVAQEGIENILGIGINK
ncbi:hypothetical protein FJR48_10125 [Sulfurimonas lithotrophica]|uniref:LPP20 lipoprotein n=1 Tax=Sulfurimonas lithotrophica TaxID=2590022 RepID=A0A5P8P3E3_9BACT|nr:LPP20 family lipoprotein [Sulfurimonas lithotrophica]QFR50060.1 hypothetical protein FJR48_10125 [Sulfurimonas lithotrophica]